MSGRRSRNKGANGERELARILRERGFQARRGARNGVAGRDGGEDVSHSIPGVWLEVKRAERLAIPQWLAQAEADCPADCLPVLAFRRSREPWRAVIRLDHLLDLLGD
jgi:hypothetical protein